MRSFKFNCLSWGFALGVSSVSLACTSGGNSGEDGEAGESGEEEGETGETGDTGVEEPDPNVDWPTLDCDPLVPSFCGYPWPNNVFTTADADSPTGRRLHFSADMTPEHSANPTDPTVFEEIDGFSAAGMILTQLPGSTRTGVATDQSIERSMESDSPTVIIDAETGEWIPHFVDIDSSTDANDERSFSLFPVTRLKDNHRYIVAIRNVVDTAGDPLAPSPAFAALRDLQVWEEGGEDQSAVEDRRPLYADIFTRLADANVPREDLQLAWDFTTQSTEDITGDLIHMRDEALAMGPFAYTIENTDFNFDPANIFVKLEGTMTVPLYTTDAAWGGTINYGNDGLPEPTGMHEVDWELLIPLSAQTEPAALIQYGHGLFGERTQIESGHFRSFMNEYNYAFFAVDWNGMATVDRINAAYVLDQGQLEQFDFMMDRMHQGILNSLMAMNMMRTSFSQDVDYGALIDPDEVYYHGISQGGILGGVYMALTTEVTRGVLGVPGQPYNLLLPRSVDFDPFFDIAKTRIKDARDIQMMLGMVQLLWNRVEPAGYTSHIASDLLPNTPTHEVFMRAAIGDHQVTTLGAHHMARTMGAVHLDTGIRSIYGLEAVDAPATSGLVYAEYEFGLPPDPVCNVPQDACSDPHGKLRSLQEARIQLDTFLRTGEVINDCASETCSFADMSGCDADPAPSLTCAEEG